MSGAAIENSRNGRLSVFDRTSSSRPALGITPDFGLSKNAWNSTSHIWGPGSSFLDGTVEDEPVRPSPMRQTSSGFGQTRSALNSMSPVEPTDENGIHPKTHWNSMSTNIGFGSRQKLQPLSPSKQVPNQGSESLPSLHGNFNASSLFAGSAPDIEDDVNDVSPPYHTARRSITSSSRPIQSPTRTGNSDHYRSEYQPRVVNHVRENDVFGSVPRPENGHHRSADQIGTLNGAGNTSGAVNGYPPARQGTHQQASAMLSRYEAVSPRYAKPHGHSSAADRTEPHASPSGQRIDNTIQSLQSLSFDHAQDNADIRGIRQVPLQQSHYQNNSHSVQSRYPMYSNSQIQTMDTTFQSSANVVQNPGSRLDPLAVPHYAGMAYGGRAAFSPTAGDYRSNLHSPYYSAAATPPTGPESVRSTPASGASSRTSHHDQMLLDHKLRSLDPYQFDHGAFAINSLHAQMNQIHQFEVPVQGLTMRFNPNAHPYISTNYTSSSHHPAASRVPAREPEQSPAVRSPILEDFRMNSKTNKRFELKDIYNHVVEFSGDQHGSRFIQQKLETANSDEKEQIFKEIQPNLLQLMTDVFGNYVIQKMFEHGNQSQKKVLANQMKGHVWTLSMQMYGCRVVQKAFEYVLADQQASLVKELEGPNAQILKVIKDQNGNHVVQKAIERIPGEHIQFIVDAHRGQAIKLSTHQYGCRVVQRMLEHCQPKAKRVLLDELLANIQPLILDSYGNYVVQHIIQNGEPQDRRFVVDIVLKQILNFSKHKFASNIVEKSIDYADEDQRDEILERLTAQDASGATPVLGLMRDQYGNYVLQKVYAKLRDAELAALEADMKQNYPVLRRTSYGKQVIAIEKLLWGGNGPSTASTSSHTSGLPSTNASSTADSPETPTNQPDGK